MPHPLSEFKKELAARELPIDTEKLQLESLYAFASKLGYKTLGAPTNNKGFCNPKTKRSHLKFLSFDTMKRLHNEPFSFYTFIELNPTAAASSRIVEKVKLQRTNNGFKVQSHYVKLVVNSKEDYIKSLLAEACPTLKPDQLEQLASSNLLKY